MNKQDRLALIKRAQALRDKGISATQTARMVDMSLAWVKDHTHEGRIKPVHGLLSKRKKEVKETCAYGIWFAKWAVHLGCKPDMAIDTVASAGLVKIGGRVV
jgi:hypothetical protein